VISGGQFGGSARRRRARDPAEAQPAMNGSDNSTTIQTIGRREKRGIIHGLLEHVSKAI
jgi:hypothetical protein